MANALRRTIAEGEVVVLNAKYYKGSEENRLFVCEDGFGMLHVTAGSRIMGYWLSDKEKGSIRGGEIDPVATKRYQESHVKEEA